jgi:methylenetetrahydrofolate dehydrogenase (NADP+)/methenyltetrahydrofolate cyclohydrolase
MIVDGRAIAEEILESVRAELNGAACLMRAVSIEPNAVTKKYLHIKSAAARKAGIELHVVELSPAATVEEVIDAINQPADAVVVQLPLPSHLPSDEIVDAIPARRDADVLSTEGRALRLVPPPVVGAVEEILSRAKVGIAGAHAVVVGKGRLVGVPVAERLSALGAHIVSYDEHDFSPESLKHADIIVTGAGVPGLVKPEMVAEGAVLVDAGTSESDGAVVGDIDPACQEKARLYTPVPGGVGPVTVACLMRNAARLHLGNI